MDATPRSFPALQTVAEDSRVVRKALKLLVFEADIVVPVADLATGYTDPSDRSKLMVDTDLWRPLGILTPDGMDRETNADEEEAEGYNYADPVRTDIIKAPKKVTITLLQDKTRTSIEKTHALDLSNVVAQKGKAFAYDEPTLPTFPYKRLMAIDLDYWEGDQSLPLYGIDVYPRVKQASIPRYTRKKQGYPELEIEYNIFTDTQLGTPGRHWLDGPGFDMEAAGFKAATA